MSVAPMMDRTDRHFRFLMRLISRHALLYTEMVTTGALLHGDRERLLAFDPSESPIALQLGGDDPEELAECARLAVDFGYDEVNLNVGCPSDRVQKGRFGACLMAEPERVARAVEAMRAAVDVPVTVKHRIGIDEIDTYDHMLRFVDTVAAAGCDRFTVHARKAWLSGLSPKENRNVPPLRHEEIHRLKRERPDLVIETNGGVTTLDEIAEHLEHVDAVMLGRAAYDHPWLFAGVDRRFFASSLASSLESDAPPPTRREVVLALADYAEDRLAEGTPLQHVARHAVNLMVAHRGARAWRRHLSQNAHRSGAGPEVFLDAMARVPDDILDERADERPASSTNDDTPKELPCPTPPASTSPSSTCTAISSPISSSAS